MNGMLYMCLIGFGCLGCFSVSIGRFHRVWI